jgi:hypothetical protein
MFVTYFQTLEFPVQERSRDVAAGHDIGGVLASLV